METNTGSAPLRCQPCCRQWPREGDADDLGGGLADRSDDLRQRTFSDAGRMRIGDAHMDVSIDESSAPEAFVAALPEQDPTSEPGTTEPIERARTMAIAAAGRREEEPQAPCPGVSVPRRAPVRDAAYGRPLATQQVDVPRPRSRPETSSQARRAVLRRDSRIRPADVRRTAGFVTRAPLPGGTKGACLWGAALSMSPREEHREAVTARSRHQINAV